MGRKLLTIALASTLALGGCAAWRAGSVQHKVTVAQHNFLTVVTAFQDAEIAEHDQGFVPNDTHVTIQGIVKKVALAAKDLDEALIANADAATLKAKLTVIYGLLDQLQADGLTGIKNAEKKATLQLALNQIKTLLDLALTQVAQGSQPAQVREALNGR
jgi:hypothetical protein